MASVGLVIPTYNGHKLLTKNLPIVLKSKVIDHILIVDSSSQDDTVSYARSLGLDVKVIPQVEFNHGATREMARKMIATDVVIMMTQDAIPIDEHVFDLLVGPIVRNEAAVTYARQIPHDGADFFEAFPRAFNYPAKSSIRSLADTAEYGPFTFFCSDSCAAWSNKALDEVGGFPVVLTGEDGVATALLLRSGHRIAYVSDAVVKHSHRYSLLEEFRRYFDTGLERRRFSKLFFIDGTDEKRGSSFATSMFMELLKNQPLMAMYGVLHLCAKFLGYKLGQYSGSFPRKLKKRLSAQPYFWTSKFAQQIN